MPVGRAVVIALLALLLAALLDAEALEDTAGSQPFGWRHDVATAAVDPVLDLSRALHLTAPRRWLEDAFDRPHPRLETPSTSTTTSVAPTPTSSPSATVPGPTTAPTPPQPSRRQPTAEEPLRLLVVGDSMTEAFGPALLDITDATSVVAGDHELRYSSGLTRPDYFDWPARLTVLLDERDPEAVVIMVGANDAQGILTPAGAASFGTPAWIDEYRARVAQVMDLLGGGGRSVYWIGLPVMRSSRFDERMALITGIYREEATRHSWIRFIDSRPIFAHEGAYSAYLPGGDGRPALVRRDDGIHFTAAGGDRLARSVLEVIARDWDVPTS